LRRVSWIRRVTNRLLGVRPGGGMPAAAVILAVAPATVARAHVPAFAVDSRPFFVELLRRAAVAAPTAAAIPGRVLLVNAGLAAGGAERQVVNTLLGLSRQPLESVAFLGEYL